MSVSLADRENLSGDFINLQGLKRSYRLLKEHQISLCPGWLKVFERPKPGLKLQSDEQFKLSKFAGREGGSG